MILNQFKLINKFFKESWSKVTNTLKHLVFGFILSPLIGLLLILSRYILIKINFTTSQPALLLIYTAALISFGITLGWELCQIYSFNLSRFREYIKAKWLDIIIDILAGMIGIIIGALIVYVSYILFGWVAFFGTTLSITILSLLLIDRL